MTRLLAITLLFGLHCGGADAAAFCVGTSAQFETALATAASNGEDDIIELGWGTYTPTGQVFSYVSGEAHSLSIVGGFIDLFGGGPCSTHVRGANFTRLDGVGSKVPLEVVFTGTAGDFNLADVVLQNGSEAGSHSSPVYIGGSADWNGNIGLNRVIVRDNAYSDMPVVISAEGGSVYIGNSVFEGNQYLTGGIGFGPAIEIHSNAPTGDGIFLLNDSFSGNQPMESTPNLMNIELSGTGYCRVVNSVFWNNSGYDLQENCQGPNGAGFWSDDIGVFNGGAINAWNGVFGKDPRFVSTTDLRPGGGSPLVDAGTNAFGLNDYDVLGQPRVVFGAVDIGAYEQPDRIFKNGFE
jgi:hypothetical protein